ncbi:tRNA (adenosine(37)-N6)-threonylcarbamoyltransferase complex ATPase subunit type 1 TsaE [Nesterenkonia lacusekhoensis]|uniref:tRNA threonylcarbamoyladenosine biosynthesis protein TsaE n=1 Tax=Nesterenkonia lacusekhoensis TaxID=150832 RepID=A0ABS4SYF8_9MICC|nr:tRNA (adenosine(37)-N6)-threonylcarbamoyltransferase complex ATPase subunit type 1 TsaE [Nesterenkonia lacusekhoensis]MBP2317235.1 tRNA threonylcarbamoyladenosine biosynthesis protein TsaE [Nesterenkonia lacusekhoensis]
MTPQATAPEDGPEAPLPGENWVLRIPLADLESTQRLAHSLAAVLPAGTLLVLTGGLGAGKTTFTQSLAEGLGVTGPVSSPTFVLSRIHPSAQDGPDLVHVDAYRTDAEGLESLDLLSTLSGSVTVIEWGRGLVEHALVGEGGSWLDLELIRDDAGDAPAAESSGPGAEPQIITDFSESEEDILGTPRRAVLRGYGPDFPAPPASVRRG